VALKVRLNGRAERDLQDIIDHRAEEHGALVLPSTSTTS
jgi:hypothetical protein